MKKLYVAILSMVFSGFLWVGCGEQKDQSVEELNQEAVRLLQDRQPGQALKSVQAAIKKAETEYGATAPEVVPGLETAGLIYQAIKDPANAEASYHRALAIIHQTQGPESEAAAKVLNSLGSLYYAQNRPDAAAEMFKKSLAIVESLFPADDPRLATLRKNIETCEKATAEAPALADNTAPETSAGANQMQTPVQDMVPAQIKKSMMDQLAKQNIFVSDLSPRMPVKMGDKGMVFPYHGIRKDKDGGSQEIMVLFAAVRNPDKPGAVVFQQCRLISYRSFLNTLEQGGVAQLTKELKEVFPGLFS